MFEKDWSNYYLLLISDSQLCLPLSTKLDFKNSYDWPILGEYPIFGFAGEQYKRFGFLARDFKPSKNYSHYYIHSLFSLRKCKLLKSPSIKLKTGHLSVIEKTRCFDEPQDSSSMVEILNKCIGDPCMYKGR